ncbi:MAG TPA: MFS transporter [Caulobacteraceae bacterium]|jgi:MFS family permease|nr:MFS transporter [Caulobacteraceae bacterium]
MTADSPTTTPALVVAPAPARARLPRYALALLLLIYVLNTTDRQIINILAEPIRKDLGLHDWQIGMLTGFSFAIFYATLGIPIARLADRGNRPLIIATAIAVWSAFTALCGVTQTFLQLVLARVGVGVGEAGCTPTAVSLISDIVPREKRASAIGIYTMGTPIGAILGMGIGGLVADIGGWRMAFLVAAAPGLVVAALAALTLKEPRKVVEPAAQPADPTPTFMEASRELRACRTYVFFVLAGTLQGLLGYGNSAFLGSFFFRNHGAALARAAAGVGLQTAGFLGLALGLIVGLGGVLGSYIGGKIADRHVATDPRGLAVQMILVNVITTPIYILAVLVGSASIALTLLLIHSIFYAICLAPTYTVLQSVVQPRTRATAVAIYGLVVNLVGLGLGPMLVGALSDYLSHGAGLGAAQGLRFALVTSASLGFLAAALYWQARKHIGRDTVS